MRSAVVLAFVLCGVQNALGDNPSAPIASPPGSFGSLASVRGYLSPALASAGKAGRIYYEAACPPSEYSHLALPQIEVRPPLANATGLAAVRSIFGDAKDVLVVEDSLGIVRVRIGKFPDAILRTRISTLRLKPMEQYDTFLAILALQNAPEVRSAMKELHVVVPAIPFIMPAVMPAEGLPHIPPELKNVTMDQALDIVAKTWGNIVAYGACTEPGTYEIS